MTAEQLLSILTQFHRPTTEYILATTESGEVIERRVWTHISYLNICQNKIIMSLEGEDKEEYLEVVQTLNLDPDLAHLLYNATFRKQDADPDALIDFLLPVVRLKKLKLLVT